MMKLLVFAAILGLAAAQLDHHVLHCKDQRPLIQIGSSTAFPISRQHAVRYANPMVAPMAFPTGSNVGFSNFLSGAADIATSSRKLMPSDYAAADCDPAGVTEDGVATEACQGRLPVGVKIASDRVTIIVSKAAVWVPEEGVTSEQVLQLFNVQEPASWRDVFPEGIVDEAFPSLPGPQTGTLTYFSEATGLNFTGSFAFSSHLSIRSFIRSHAFAIGILPYSFAAVATEDVNVLNVDGINPLDREAEGYPYERPLYKYYDAAPGADNEQALDFLCTLLDTEGQQIIEIAGHIPLPEEERAAEYEMLGCESRNVVNKLDELTGPMQEASFCRDAVKLVAMGSSTVFPIIEEVGRVYPNPIVNIVARSSGSSVGMDSLIEGAADIAMMSRLVQVSDYTKFGCRSSGVQGTRAVSDCNGVRPNAITIGTDMLAIIAHPDSELSDLSMEDVMAIFVNQTTENMLYVPDSNSGTRDFFEANVGPIDTQGFSDDNEIITNIAADVNGIGFVGAAYATDPRVKVLSVEGISPLDNNPEYAMSRALWLYYDGSDDHYNKAMNEFLCWMLNADGGQKVVESVGYLPLEETDRLTEAFLRGCLELPESFGM